MAHAKSRTLRILDAVRRALGSKYFWLAVLVFFALESLWIAFIADYPQAFDENFHFGLIQLYSHYWLPFFTSQPPGGDAFGSVATMPSYLYHYLMSFPYRIMALFVHSQMGQIIILRILDIILFGAGLILFRKVLRRIGMSRAFSHTALAIFVLIPIVPQVAAQPSYDNLLFPMVAVTCLVAFHVIDSLRRRQPSARAILGLLIVCLLTTMVKYAYLPIFLAAIIFVIAYAWRSFRGKGKKLFWRRLWQSWKRERRWVQILLVIGVIIGLGLFAQREGANLVKYHQVKPNCANVLSVEACNHYYVFHADHLRHIDVANHPDYHYMSIFHYAVEWCHRMWYRLFFSVSGPDNGYNNMTPLPLPTATVLVIGGLGIVAVAVALFQRRLFKGQPFLAFATLAAFLYMAILLADGFRVYHQTHVLELMNGRYLLPVLPLLAALAGRALHLLLGKKQWLKTVFATLAILLFLDGGGVFTFIVHSNNPYYWPKPYAQHLSDSAKHAVSPFIVKDTPHADSWNWFLGL
jgi:hypothetical protein